VIWGPFQNGRQSLDQSHDPQDVEHADRDIEELNSSDKEEPPVSAGRDYNSAQKEWLGRTNQIEGSQDAQDGSRLDGRDNNSCPNPHANNGGCCSTSGNS
jgi:hypothetical protein